MNEHDECYTGTPYDDVFRTVLNDCPVLILPVLNEIFHTEYTGEENIVFKSNEHFLNQQDGKEEKRITDSSFQVIVAKQMGTSATPKEYHIECQSTEDSGMLVRFFEYDSQIAIDGSILEENRLRVRFPHSAALYLRSGKNTPDELMLCLETPGGNLEYPIPIMKCQSYTLSEILTKNYCFCYHSIYLHMRVGLKNTKRTRINWQNCRRNMHRLKSGWKSCASKKKLRNTPNLC